MRVHAPQHRINVQGGINCIATSVCFVFLLCILFMKVDFQWGSCLHWDTPMTQLPFTLLYHACSIHVVTLISPAMVVLSLILINWLLDRHWRSACTTQCTNHWLLHKSTCIDYCIKFDIAPSSLWFLLLLCASLLYLVFLSISHPDFFSFNISFCSLYYFVVYSLMLCRVAIPY